MKRALIPFIMILALSSSAFGYAYESVDGFENTGWGTPLDEDVMLTHPCCTYDSSTYEQNFDASHTGVDIGMGDVEVDDEVYAIADGTIIGRKLHCNDIGSGDPETLNLSVVLVEHEAKDGTHFTAIYGHTAPVDTNCDNVANNVKYDMNNTRKTVKKGEVIGHLREYNDIHLHFGIAVGATRDTLYGGWGRASSSEEMPAHWRDPEVFLTNHKNTISRADALHKLLNKFRIPRDNDGFNQTRFGQPITIPMDVTPSTEHYDDIVIAYNKGIVGGDNDKFNPEKDILLAEFLIMIDRAIPIPLDNPNYETHPYSHGKWYEKYITAAYNAEIIEDKNYPFENVLSKDDVDDLLDHAYDYFLGPNSGISIYARWFTQYADVDLYLFDAQSAGNVTIEHTDYVINNIWELIDSGGLVYWSQPTSYWGANLDYDSWGSNGYQPWAGIGEERITVDSLMVRRPGVYDIILCYYDWDQDYNPPSVDVEWWGINRGRNINVGGGNFNTALEKDKCHYVGYLNTY